MTNDAERAESYCCVIRDFSAMDSTVAERLRAAVEMSLVWADQTLDVLIRLEDDLQTLGTVAEHQRHPLQAAQSVQRLRGGVRDIMMSMQNQDVIGQAIGRAAAALEKRAAAVGRVAEEADSFPFDQNEVAEIHREYRSEDDLHRAAGPGEEEYKAAA